MQPSYHVNSDCHTACFILQWVDDTVPLYELYTAWQQQRLQRQRLVVAAAAGNAQQQTAAAAGAAASAAAQQQERVLQQMQLRPVDVYYAKLKVEGMFG